MWLRYLIMFYDDKLVPGLQLWNTFKGAVKFYLFLSEGMQTFSNIEWLVCTTF